MLYAGASDISIDKIDVVIEEERKLDDDYDMLYAGASDISIDKINVVIEQNTTLSSTHSPETLFDKTMLPSPSSISPILSRDKVSTIPSPRPTLSSPPELSSSINNGKGRSANWNTVAKSLPLTRQESNERMAYLKQKISDSNHIHAAKKNDKELSSAQQVPNVCPNVWSVFSVSGPNYFLPRLIVSCLTSTDILTTSSSSSSRLLPRTEELVQ